MRVGELFAGVGGFGLSAERVWGVGCVRWASEIEPFAREWYGRLFPDVRLYGDVRDLQGADLEPVDLICGGFPCTDLSVANPKGKGLDGPRSGLWTEFARLIRECQPSWAVVENVPPLLRRGFAVVRSDLRAAGYRVARPVLMSAAFLGAPHGRSRLWIVAHNNNGRCQGDGFSGNGGRDTPRATTSNGALVGNSPPRGQRGDGRAPGDAGHHAEPSEGVDDADSAGLQAGGSGRTGRDQRARRAEHGEAPSLDGEQGL